MSEPTEDVVEEESVDLVDPEQGNNRPQDPNETQDIRYREGDPVIEDKENEEDADTDDEDTEVVEPEAAVEEEAAPAPDDLAEFRDA